MPDVEVVATLLGELKAAAKDSPDRTFAQVDDTEFSYRESFDLVTGAARGLSSLGIAPGDRVLLLLPNIPEALWSWLAVGAAGAIDVPVSEDAMGASLARTVAVALPRAVITTSALLGRLNDAGALGEVATSIKHVILVDPDATVDATTPYAKFGDLIHVDDAAAPLPSVRGSDMATVMFSSGSTGAPKGVMIAHEYYATMAGDYDPFYKLSGSKTVYCPQPLCHIDARIHVINVLARRGTIVIPRRFSATRFWTDVEAANAEMFSFIGAMLPILMKQPAGPRPATRRVGIGSSIPTAMHADFEFRFNTELIEGYGMTEFPAILNQSLGEGGPGNVGRPLAGAEVRIIDSSGMPLPQGSVGELVVRPTRRGAHMQGYWRNPEATVQAWQGLWFHTGDLLQELEDGSFRYIGRLKDSIRRRGENISAWEVERTALAHPGVLDAAAIGVPSPLGEEDVALVVIPRPDTNLDPAELRTQMSKDLPRFALPRFIDVVADLPKTPSHRVAKAELRARGLSVSVYDAEGRPA
ncbi:hypothetical protein EXE59_14580 [Nocardioides eburneiflavus]|uniref:ATP-dependent acyl-CoA ligase n=1 Tax=Nocardioides eburneiflavus TaxID=2518372 RepID=A0A4Z1C446_9ACTN|nr:AMP-binding protein [Nocardioides eburneiflavus]TGN65054.1 hypothetical protein EXE59_14580 [Nocardioides eburneiflavus]